MWFKNLCIYRLNDAFTHDPEALEEMLAQFAFQPVGRTEMNSRGWVPPLGRQGEQLVHASTGYLMVCLQEESRVLPAAVIREILDERIAERENKEMRKLGRREKNRMKEELTLELLPQAFTKSKRTYAYIDPKGGWIVVDTGAWRQAEEITELLRTCIGTLPIRPLQTMQNPQAVLTRWLETDQVPSDIELGDEAVLEDPQSEGAEVRVKRQDLQSTEIKNHVKAGKRIRRLSLTWDERMSAVVDTDLSIKRLKFLDVVQDDAGDRDAETAQERFDADFTIMAMELARLFPRLVDLFGGEPALDAPAEAAAAAE